MSLNNREYIAIGVMSGTSLDGLDMSLCNYSLEEGKWSFKILDTAFIEYDKGLVEKIKSIYGATARELAIADVEFGEFIGKNVKGFAKKNKMKVDLVASHGQTIFHDPARGYTLQIGSGAVISKISGLTVVSDFRQQDVTSGGQGAPLVPAGDALLFPEYGACLNLGGFANISFLQKTKRIAFDICAVNFVINRLSGMKGLKFDANGKLAEKGALNKNLLSELNQLDYYKEKHPKSLGQEWVEKQIFPLIEGYNNIPLEDLLNTYYEHVGGQISETLKLVEGDDILITGGGAKNTYLLHKIKGNTKKKIIVPDEKIIDFKESIIFGLLGVLRIRGDVNCYASVTGAMNDSCTGAVYLP